MPLINCEINVILTWSENRVLTSKDTKDALPAQGGNPAVTAIRHKIVCSCYYFINWKW